MCREHGVIERRREVSTCTILRSESGLFSKNCRKAVAFTLTEKKMESMCRWILDALT